jgi:hypothetical protein
MKKKIFKYLLIIVLFISIAVSYLSTVGVETARLNNQIINQINNLNENLEIELRKIKLVLDPFNFSIKAKTVGPKLKNGEKIIEIESIKTQISLNSFIYKKFSLTDLEISSKPLEIKNLISFVRTFKKGTELYILERLIKKGYLIVDINLEFDSQGKIKDNYSIKGFLKDGKISLVKKYNIDKLNFIFNLNNKRSIFQDISLSANNIPFSSEKITLLNKGDHFFIDGEIINKNIIIEKNIIDLFVNPNISNLIFNNINLSSNNKFSFKINKKLDINNFQLLSDIRLNNLSILNNTKLEKLLPNIKKEIKFSNHKVKINYNKKNLQIDGSGKILLQNNEDEIRYSINKKNKIYKFNSFLNIDNNPLTIDFLNFKKNEDSKASISIKGKHILDDETLINIFSLQENQNKIKVEELKLSKNFKIKSLKKINLHYFDINNIKNKLSIIKKKNDYIVKGTSFNADKLIENLVHDDNEKKIDFFHENFDLKLEVDQVYLDKEHNIKNLKGKLYFENNKIVNGNLNASFSKNKKFNFTVNSSQNEKVTTFYVDNAEPIVKRYKFIKGFEEGSLDFYSSTKGDKSNSTVKIYNFKLKELPALTKLLTLASLQGIADILSGEGIRFDEFEMNFENEKKLMTIKEIYAIGPAISVLINGYVEKDKMISLRGTLVPATTINKAIGSIPVLGKILVGSKSGEGVFGVSFKIKGAPKNVETTVNPIKTLTPRFITRTLEKIKKN